MKTQTNEEKIKAIYKMRDMCKDLFDASSGIYNVFEDDIIKSRILGQMEICLSIVSIINDIENENEVL